MRLVDRTLWLCLLLVLNACSLVTDFPEPLDGGAETGKKGDAGGSKSGAVCTDKATCGPNELCCAGGSDGKKHCQADNGKKECGVACDPLCAGNEQAPVCSNGKCACTSDGKTCPSGQVCDTETGVGECVVCTNNTHCAGNTNGRKVCVAHQCVACDRKDPANPSDDEGCPAKTPVCNAEGVCVGCKAGDCPVGQQCVPGHGCFGCTPGLDPASNNCNPTNPVCLPEGDGFQCGKCTKNGDCGSGYCDETVGVGTCHNECDPNMLPGQSGNGCAMSGAPICKASASGQYSCQPCTANDKCPASPTQVCATTGPSAGTCVTAATTCMPGMTLVQGRCVCTSDMQCAANPAGPVCNLTTGACGPCTATPSGDAACARISMATPICGAAGTCVACRTNAQCTGNARTPICSAAGACVACGLAGATPAAANDACAAISRSTPICVTSGDFAGACGGCSPGASLSESTCAAGRPFCYSVDTRTPPVCNECVRDTVVGVGSCDLTSRTPFCLLNSDDRVYECTRVRN